MSGYTEACNFGRPAEQLPRMEYEVKSCDSAYKTGPDALPTQFASSKAPFVRLKQCHEEGASAADHPFSADGKLILGVP